MLRAKIWRWVFRKSATYIEHYVRELPFFFSSYHDCNITTRITEQWRQENSTDLMVIQSSKWKKNNKLSSLIKNTFRNATTGTSEVRAQKFHTDDVTLPRSRLCFWLCRNGNLLQPIRSTTQTYVVTRHQYGISALVLQTSVCWETSGGFKKLWLFSQVTNFPEKWFSAHLCLRAVGEWELNVYGWFRVWNLSQSLELLIKHETEIHIH